MAQHTADDGKNFDLGNNVHKTHDYIKGVDDVIGIDYDSPTSLAIMPDLVGHIRKLEIMYKVLLEEINAILRLTLLFNHTKKFEITELANAKTDPTKNHQYNGDTPPLGTQPCSLHSPLTYTLVTPVYPPPCPRFEAIYDAFIARSGDLPDVCLLGADKILFGVYQDWAHQNTRNHLDGGIT